MDATRHIFWPIIFRFFFQFQLLLDLAVRALVMGVLPVIIYVACFYVHLNVLTKAGPHDNVMTSAFQASLEVRKFI